MPTEEELEQRTNEYIDREEKAQAILSNKIEQTIALHESAYKEIKKG